MTNNEQEHKSDGGPAFPQPICDQSSVMAWRAGMGGCSFRDLAALAVLPELISDDISLSPEKHARTAYRYADAMVRESEKP